MSIYNILPILEKNNKFKSIVKNINSSKNFDMSLFTPAKDFFLAAFLRVQKKPFIIITDSAFTANELYERLLYYLGDEYNILMFPESDDIYYEDFSKNHDIEMQRIRCLASIEYYYKHKTIPIIVSSLNSITDTTITRKIFHDSCKEIKINNEENLKQLVSFFISIGYEHEPIVDVPGKLSVRGGLIDIYSPNYPNPVRIEFCYCVGASGIKRSGFGLRSFLNLAVELTRGGLIETAINSRFFDGIQKTQGTKSVHLSGVLRHFKRNGDVTLRSEIVDLIRRNILHQARQIR